MDFITDLPPIDDCDSILIVVDRGNTKGAILISTAKTLTQEGAGQLLLDNLYKWFGLPDKMLSDRGLQFAAKAFHEPLKLLRINQIWQRPIIHRQIVPLNKSIRKLKLTCQFVALHILPNRKTPYPHWNLPITIDDTLIEPTLHLNWWMAKAQ
jgi:hypothetical protein